MTRNLSRLVGLLGAFYFTVFSLHPQAASALDTPNTLLDTPNTLMGIDAMVMRAAGIFRSPDFGTLINGNDGFNTFQFGSYEVQNPITAGQGRYDAFRFRKTDVGDCCITHNARFNSNTPLHSIDSTATPQAVSYINNNLTSAIFPIIDRAAFGQRFNPDQYQIEVKFKPLLSKATADSLGTNPFPTNPTYPNITATLENTAPFFTVSLDQHGGFVWDAETGRYKRAAEQIFYNIGNSSEGDYNSNGIIDTGDYTIYRDHRAGMGGTNFTLPNENPAAVTPGVVDDEDYNTWKNRFGSKATPLNKLYAAAPHDAQGYATITIPLTSPSDIGRSPYFSNGDGDFRTNNVVTNGGRRLNPVTQLWEDVEVGYGPDFRQFGGGPSDPNNPGSKLDTPNGVPVMYLGSPSAQLGLSVEIKSIAMTKINPGTLVARIDANSGIGFRLGTGLTYTETQPGITVPGVPTPVTPPATDQISRFEQVNGNTNMTNLKINMRTPDPDATPETPDTTRFIIRSAAVPTTFDATNAVVNVRAKLLQPLTDAGVAQSLTLVAKARKGNDTAANLGADEWNYILPLNLFNTSTMTTVPIQMSAFTRNMMSSALGAAPAGFAYSGDGTLTNFGLYEFGGLLPVGSGLLKLELEFMEMRLPAGSGQLAYNAVPEPTTLSLLALSLAAVALRRRGR